MRSLKRREVRAIDRYAIDTLGIPGVVLMENAGRNAADLARDMLGENTGRVAVLAGAGNNGGDGFVIARHLLREGVETDVYLVVPEEKIAGDAEVNLKILKAMGEAVQPTTHPADDLPVSLLKGFDLLIDALGGTGISGALRGSLAEAVERLNAADRPVLAVDIPTGLDCDTGTADGPAVRAARTVTFVARKAGFDAPGSEAFTGEVHLADIGIDADAVARAIGLVD